MLPNEQHPQPGADVLRPGTWRIYILDPHGLRWRPIAMMADRATAEYHLASLKKFIPGRQFSLAWEGNELK